MKCTKTLALYQTLYDYIHFSFLYGWDVPSTQCFNSTKAPDGLDAVVVPFQSGLINGKGKWTLIMWLIHKILLHIVSLCHDFIVVYQDFLGHFAYRLYYVLSTNTIGH